jgi:Domain of unknown function (DUF4398)
MKTQSPHKPLLLTALLSVLLLAACASTPVPSEQMAVSTAAVAGAVAAGAPELAPAEMALARDKMGRANAAIAAKDNDAAMLLLQQAAVDAQVAEAKAEAVKARKASDALQEAARVLREEMARKAAPQPKP